MGECYSRDLEKADDQIEKAKLNMARASAGSPRAAMSLFRDLADITDSDAESLWTPRGARCAPGQQVSNGHVRGAAEAYYRIGEVVKRGHVRLDIGRGAVCFVRQLVFRRRTDGRDKPTAELSDGCGSEEMIDDVVEVARLLGGPLIVEGHLVKARHHPEYHRWGQKLSEERARLVVELLVARGMSRELISSRGQQSLGKEWQSSFHVTIFLKDFVAPDDSCRSSDEIERSRAALHIQSAFRRHKLRNGNRGDREERAEDEEIDPQEEVPLDECAAIIQALFRGHKARQFGKYQQFSATKIQAAFRGLKSRQFCKYETYNATKIQAAFKGLRARQLRDEIKGLRSSGATKIQSAFRGLKGRRASKELHKLKQQMESLRQRKCAAKIQSAFKEWQFRQLSNQTSSALKIQGLYRGHQARQARELYETLRREEAELRRKLSAVRIQSVLRGWKARQLSASLKKKAKQSMQNASDHEGVSSAARQISSVATEHVDARHFVTMPSLALQPRVVQAPHVYHTSVLRHIGYTHHGPLRALSPYAAPASPRLAAASPRAAASTALRATSPQPFAGRTDRRAATWQHGSPQAPTAAPDAGAQAPRPWMEVLRQQMPEPPAVHTRPTLPFGASPLLSPRTSLRAQSPRNLDGSLSKIDLSMMSPGISKVRARSPMTISTSASMASPLASPGTALHSSRDLRFGALSSPGYVS
eukprot:TRINITY_DN24779_c0_g1_i1.p1 TRINITY_DN24779_c0_g1~~TRINITY_DN24779_c0_g1_i1.p1  ORF type:complete len:729 (-),score=115.60 TRINITY_DN24779_c0_g1_i1:96-2204(-)